MAHHTAHRRILASQDPPKPNHLSMDPSHKSQSSTYLTTKNPDPILPSKPFSMSKLNPSHKFSTTTKNPPCIDTHLQAKAMTVSADFDASRFSLVKPKYHQQRKIDPKLERESRRTAKEAVSKEKRINNKLSSKALLNKKKVEEEAVVSETNKKEMCGKVKDSKVVNDLVEWHDIKRMSSVSLGDGGGRRRSLCGSQVELADFLASNGAKVVSVDMPPFMQIHAVDCARKTHDSLEKFTSKTLALTLKKEFDGVYGPAWHCIVGTSFGSFVTHSVGGFLYFSMDQKLYVLLFKTTVQRAD